MATSRIEKTPCAICGKISGMFTCRGCQQNFCTRHVAEHRQELGKQMDEITMDHDRFRQSLTEQTEESHDHPLIQQIDQWEEQSIRDIHRSADDARKKLWDSLIAHTTKLTEQLTKIANELRQARENDDFFETDLHRWMNQLNQLKNDLTTPPNITIRRENNTIIPIIQNTTGIALRNETFGRVSGSIYVEDNAQVIVKGRDYCHQAARGKNTYISGQHRLRFQIEEYHKDKWIFIGIVSENVPLEQNPFSSSSLHGWAGHDQVYFNGVYYQKFNDYKSDIEKNDIVELFLDCDHRLIRLTNERTKSVSELPIEIDQCPFPWQLNFILFYVNDRLRILSS